MIGILHKEPNFLLILIKICTIKFSNEIMKIEFKLIFYYSKVNKDLMIRIILLTNSLHIDIYVYH